MLDIIERLSFDATRCEIQFSKGVATNIEDGIAEIVRLRKALGSIARNTCCDGCQEAAKVAKTALEPPHPAGSVVGQTASPE